MNGRKIRLSGFAALVALALVWSCGKDEHERLYDDYDSVMIMVSAGRNSLNSNLQWDIEDMKGGYVPEWNEHKALVVVSHFLAQSYLYPEETEVYVTRLVRGRSGHVYADTLKSWPATTLLTPPARSSSSATRIPPI